MTACPTVVSISKVDAQDGYTVYKYIYIYVYKFLRSKNMHTKADVVVYVDLRHVAFAI